MLQVLSMDLYKILMYKKIFVIAILTIKLNLYILFMFIKYCFLLIK